LRALVSRREDLPSLRCSYSDTHVAVTQHFIGRGASVSLYFAVGNGSRKVSERRISSKMPDETAACHLACALLPPRQHVMDESRRFHRRRRPPQEAAIGVATPYAVADSSRVDGVSARGGSGRFASASQLASAQGRRARHPGSPTMNRPPETLRAGPGGDAATDLSSPSVANEKRRLSPDARPERDSARLGAESAEACVLRLLRGAGAHVSARDVRERSGLGSPAASMLLKMALEPVRAHPRQHRANVVPIRRRSSTRSLS